MKVRIVDKKYDVAKEMTVEELAEKEFIGYETCGAIKYMLSGVEGCGITPSWFLCRASWVHTQTWNEEGSDKVSVIKFMASQHESHIHVFDTAKELYQWMAE